MSDTLPPSTSPVQPQEVSWQTCFFLLLALALNNMAQPSGSILGASPKYSIYIRCSPTVGVVDILRSLMQVLEWTYLEQPRSCRITLFSSLKRFLSLRFYDTDGEEPAKKARDSMGVRWLMFILSALPAAIKILSLKGVSWTQVIAVAYVISWLVTEAFIWIAANYPVKVNQIDSVRYWFWKRCVGHGMTVDIMTPVARVILDLTWNLKQDRGLKMFLIIPWAGTFFVLWVALGGLCMLWVAIMEIVVGKSETLARNLLVAKEAPQLVGGVTTVDRYGLMCFGAFLISLISAILGYRFLYDPTGTEDPGWTAIFG